MGASGLSSRAIIGSFYKKLEELGNADWVSKLAMHFESNQESETYKWLGAAPAMREWIGGRQAKGFRENGITIENKLFEASMEVLVDDLRRDKTGQIKIRVEDLAVRAYQHWNKLLSTLIIGGETGVCYDGQYFFDTDHSEGNSGTQSNDLSVDISALPIASELQGSTTAPSAAVMAQVIIQCIQAILGFKDDQGEPLNEGAQSFLVMCPNSLMSPVAGAISNQFVAAGEANLIKSVNFKLEMAANTRLTWTNKIAVFRTDGIVKPFIQQEELGVKMDAIAEGSELEIKENKHIYGVKAIRNVGYGYWQHACLATMA